MSSRHLAPLTLATALAFVLVLVSTASAQEGLELRVRDTNFGSDGRTSLQLNVTGPAKPNVLEPDAFSVSENGQQIEQLEVTPLLESEEVPVAAVLAIDSSGSMVGEPLNRLKEASVELVTTLTGQGIPVGLLQFDTFAERLSDPTTDADVLVGAIGPIEAGGRTALYDAVVEGVGMLDGLPGTRTLIVLADGEDNQSAATQSEAIAAAQAAEVEVTVVALVGTDVFDPDALQPLASETDGSYITTEDTGEFGSILEAIAEDVASQYRVTYTSELAEAAELSVEVTVTVDDVQASQQFVVPNPRGPSEQEGAAPTAPTPVAVPEVGRLGEPAVLAIALFSAFLALLLLFSILFVPRTDRAASRTLRRGVTMVQRGENRSAQPSTGMTASTIGRAAMDLVDKAPKPTGYDERLQTQLDRAGWQVRATEFTTIRIVAILVGLAGMWALTGSFLLALVGGVLGLLGPGLVLSNAKTRRQAKFMKQLPDTLQLLAGTLKAGYGVLQAIDTVVKEVEEPTSTEFQRALTEARLGLPLEDSLGDMAERVDSDDFRWVVVAMNIQRQVGGNLAELLETVSATLRGREQVRRQISALSAEGKLSAIVLIALPFVIVGFMLVANQEYLAPLLTTALGLMMLGVVSVLMVAGMIWIRKMIAIDV
jgi:tight adherence protein B